MYQNESSISRDSFGSLMKFEIIFNPFQSFQCWFLFGFTHLQVADLKRIFEIVQDHRASHHMSRIFSGLDSRT